MSKESYKELVEKSNVKVVKQVQLEDGYYVIEDRRISTSHSVLHKIKSSLDDTKAITTVTQRDDGTLRIKLGNLLFVSGQIPIDPATNEVVKGGIKEQTERVLENVRAILEAANLTLDDVVMAFVYLSDMADFPQFNEVYSRYFKERPPARVTVAVKSLPRDVKVEIAVIAGKG